MVWGWSDLATWLKNKAIWVPGKWEWAFFRELDPNQIMNLQPYLKGLVYARDLCMITYSFSLAEVKANHSATVESRVHKARKPVPPYVGERMQTVGKARAGTIGTGLG